MSDEHETVTLACAAIAQARTGRELGDVWGSWAGTLRELPRGVAEPALCDVARAWWARCAALEVSEELLSELRRAHRCPSVPAELLERSRPSSSAPGALLEGLSADVARAPTEPPAPLVSEATGLRAEAPF